jgi:hypothetical protein
MKKYKNVEKLLDVLQGYILGLAHYNVASYLHNL